MKKCFRTLLLVGMSVVLSVSCGEKKKEVKQPSVEEEAPVVNAYFCSVVNSDSQLLWVASLERTDTIAVPIQSESVDVTEYYGGVEGSPAIVFYTGTLGHGHQVVKVVTDPTYHKMLGAWTLGNDSLCFGAHGLAFSTGASVGLAGWNLTGARDTVTLIYADRQVAAVLSEVDGKTILTSEGKSYLRAY